jgi:hypothetical protein
LGVDLNCVTIEPGTLFFRKLMDDEFDVFEMSISEQQRDEAGIEGRCGDLRGRLAPCKQGLGHDLRPA